ISNGVHGIAVGGSTGEGHTLALDEYVKLVDTAVDAVNGRVPLIAGIITDSTRDAIKRGQMVQQSGVAALQVTPVHYLFKPTDSATIEHFRAVTEETGMPVIIYNVVPWSYIEPELLCRLMREIPGVIGVKQSAGDMKLFADLMIMADADHLVFSAVDALLYSCYALGAHGAIAAILAAAPGPSVALWEAAAAGQLDKAVDLHERILRLWNAINGHNLPACTKYAQTLQKIPAGLPRKPMTMPEASQQSIIRSALDGLGLI
ncbi:MAG TPA: dihydrodipicolinate synthase family protein, partial [Gammaproteobacteria bacterium]|nr:dihydrodipicolinate synthase family protein [Gammaproteobacteria bacterium]